MSINRTVKEHYVPQMYLKRFTIDGNFCYTLNHEMQIHKQSINTICYEKNLYELRTPNNKIFAQNFLEKDFFCQGEIAFNSFLNYFLNYVKLGQKIDKENRLALSIFAYFLFHRNKFVIEFIENLFEGNFSDNEKRNATIATTILAFTRKTTIFFDNYDFILHFNKTKIPFVTSNLPFRVYPTLDINQKLLNIWYLPISSEILLVMVPKVPEKSFQYSKIRNVEDYQTLKYDRFFMANKTVLSDYRNIVLESTESFVLFINKMFLKRHKEIIVISKNEESLKSLK